MSYYFRSALPLGWRLILVFLILAVTTRVLLLISRIAEVFGNQPDSAHIAIVASGHFTFLVIAALLAWSIVDRRFQVSKPAILLLVIFLTVFDVLTWMYAGKSNFGPVEISVVALGILTAAVLFLVPQLKSEGTSS